MARRYGERTGNALKDGYTCFAESPRTAISTTFMSHEDAKEFDEETEAMNEFRHRHPRRRLNHFVDDDYLD